LLFGSDGSGNFVAHEAKTGKPLWHTRIGTISNAPQTYMVDGEQYVLIATGDMLWAFTCTDFSDLNAGTRGRRERKQVRCRGDRFS
jgi:outer membrane protein assembly factor BamB